MKLPKNMGNFDRAIRFIIATILVTLYFTGIVSGFWGIILLLFTIATTFTGVSGFCPLYPVFGWNTCKMKEKKE
jgi:hypothetical protein